MPREKREKVRPDAIFDVSPCFSKSLGLFPRVSSSPSKIVSSDSKRLLRQGSIGNNHLRLRSMLLFPSLNPKIALIPSDFQLVLPFIFSISTIEILKSANRERSWMEFCENAIFTGTVKRVL